MTTTANRTIAPITDRMPALLREEDWALWLGETGATLADVKDLLRTYEEEPEAWEVSLRANQKNPDPRPSPIYFNRRLQQKGGTRCFRIS
jgi:putative SOS response-associated peptidase YedK